MKIVLLSIFIFQFIATSCQPNKNMSDKNDAIETKAKEYLEKTLNDKVTSISINIDRNEGNFTDKEFTYSGHYQTEKLEYRNAYLRFYDDKELRIVNNTYWQELACLHLDKKAVNELSGVEFLIWNQINEVQDDPVDIEINHENFKEKQSSIFTNTTLKSRLVINAPDIKEKKLKYQIFHVDLMRFYKENNIEKGDLEFYFLKADGDLEALHSGPTVTIGSSNKNYNSILEKWISIHNIKWYDMVKDHPEKVLKYGKVITY